MSSKELAQYRKAIYGALMAGLTALATALTNGHVTALEWCGVALAVVVSAGTVWGVKNAPYTRGRKSSSAHSPTK